MPPKGNDVVGYSHDRRDETATPLCGAHRNTGKNALLIKPQLGTVRATTYDLPKDFEHEYGLPQVHDGLTSEMVVGTWKSHDGTKGMMPARDFKTLNKMAVRDGYVGTKAIADFRSSSQMRLPWILAYNRVQFSVFIARASPSHRMFFLEQKDARRPVEVGQREKS